MEQSSNSPILKNESRRKVLFLCTGNSCRSQMAQAIVNARFHDSWDAFSAGTKPAGYVHPKAIQVLNEINIHHDGKSKHVDDLRHIPFDLVVTVCDSAAEECPVWLGPGQRIHLSFPDPAKASGTEKEVHDQFRLVRDDIAQKVPELLQKISEAGTEIPHLSDQEDDSRK